MAETKDELRDLLARTALRDQSAFQKLYEAAASRLNGVAYRILQDVDSANEVLQEGFIQIWNNAGEYRSDLAEPFTWMASIVRYRAYDRVRAENRRFEGAGIATDLEALDKVTISGENSDSCDMSGRLEDCLKRLDQVQQKAILMAYYYGFSRDEISSEFSTPVNTVKSWLRRGLVRLQQCLSN